MKSKLSSSVSYFLFLAFFSAIHMILGANIINILIALLAIYIGSELILRQQGPNNLFAIIVFLIMFRYIGFPFILKAILLQPIDSNLFSPTLSFSYVTIGIFAYYLAAKFAMKIDFGKSLLKPILDSTKLLRTSYALYIIGFILQIYCLFKQSKGEATFILMFNDILSLSLVCSLASKMIRTNGRNLFSYMSIFTLITIIIFSLLSSSRSSMVLPIIICILVSFAFGKKSTKRILTLTLSSIPIIFLITPIILQNRYVDSIYNLSLTEFSEGRVKGFFNFSELQENYRNYKDMQEDSNTNNLKYYGESNNIFERFSHVNHLDNFISSTFKPNNLGVLLFEDAFKRIIPKFLQESKDFGYSDGDLINCEYGFYCNTNGYSTVALISTAYTMYGIVGVFIIPLIFGFSFFAFVKKIAGNNLNFNIWTIFIFAITNNAIVESGIAGYLVMFFRVLPQYFILMLMI